MRKSFKTAGIAVAAAALIGALAGAPAAMATPAPIPLSPQSTMSSYACSTPGLGNVNLTTLEFTAASAAQSCVMSNYNVAAYNPVDAHVYAMNVPGSGSVTLVANDVQGRKLTLWSGQDHIVISGTSGFPSSFAINPIDGTAVVNDVDGKIYNLNLATGVASSPVTTSPNVGGLYAMAYAPDGTLYGYTSGGTQTLYRINASSGVVTQVVANLRTALPNNSGNVYGLAFDANGNAYFAAAADNGGGDAGTSFYSASVNDIAGTVAMFTSSTQTANYGHPWTGTPTPWLPLTTLFITYGNLAVVFDSTGGTTQASSRFYSKTINDSVTPHIVNPTISLPTPTRTGYTFKGWFTAASGGTLIGLAGASYTPYSDVSIPMFAQWTEDELAVTGFDAAPYAVTSSILLALGLSAILIARRRKQN